VSQAVSAESKQLRELARLYGVQPSHYDISGQLNRPPPEALLAVLRTLGAPVEQMSDIPGALRARCQELWQRTADAVIVLWDGQPGFLKLHLPSSLAQAAVAGTVELESGATLANLVRDDGQWQRAERSVEGAG